MPDLPDLIPLDEAQRRVLDGIAPLPTEMVDLAGAIGLVLAAPAVHAGGLYLYEVGSPDVGLAAAGYAARAQDASTAFTRVNLAEECKKLEKEMSAGTPDGGLQSAWRQFDLRAYEILPDGIAVGKSVADVEKLFPSAYSSIESPGGVTSSMPIPQPPLRPATSSPSPDERRFWQKP